MQHNTDEAMMCSNTATYTDTIPRLWGEDTDMKLDTQCDKVGQPDDNDHLMYTPIVTRVLNDVQDSQRAMSHQMATNVPVVEETLQQITLQRYDALHYWFEEGDTDGICAMPNDPAEKAGHAIAHLTYQLNLAHMTKSQVPDWKRVRDLTTFIAGPGMGDEDQFRQAFLNELGDGYVHIDVDDMWGRENNSLYSVLYKLCNLEKDAKDVIVDRLAELGDVRKALRYMALAPDDNFHIVHGEGEPSVTEEHRKWFWESRWMTDYLLAKIPRFRKNFHTLVITGALRRFMTDELSFNRLYRAMALLGRVNTKIVFIG